MTTPERFREQLAIWMGEHGFATGHGDTLDDLLGELSWQVRELRERLFAGDYPKLALMAAAHCQGGHSHAGDQIASAFGIPFPLTMDGLALAAIRLGYKPSDVWPWLKDLRQ